MKKYIIAAFFFLALLAGMTGCKKDGLPGHNAGAAMAIDSFTATQGGGGTEVLINGSNFSADISSIHVTINGNPLAIVAATYHQVMAVVPKKCGSGHVIVKIGGDSVVSAGIFNYTYTRTVSTFAGNGVAGFANGKGTDAQFNFNGQNWYRSLGLAIDDNLNLYVADPGNHCIRKIDSVGNVTTFAGNPNVSGYADGQGTAAQFSIPYGVAVDPAGNVYSADPGNWDIRKITPDGTTTTIAWGTQAPWCVAFDKITNLPYYASNSGPGNIYQVPVQWTSTAVVSGLNYPAGIAFDNSGNLYAAVSGDYVIEKFAAGTWNASVIAGQPGIAGYVNGAATAAKFDHPWGLTVDASGNIYVAGNGTWDGGTYNTDQSIRYIEAGSLQVSTFAGSGIAGYTDAVGAAAAFSAPSAVVVDKNGTAYVLDKNNNMIRKIVSE